MKKIIFLLSFAVATTCCSAQNTDNTKPVTKNDFLQKSKNQKTGAWVLVGGGGGLLIVGAIISFTNSTSEALDAITLQEVKEKDKTLQTVLMVTGGAAILGSIPLFVASSRNKHKAASLTFKSEFFPQLQNSMVFYKPIPSISLKINL